MGKCECGKDIAPAGRGRIPRYCSNACRQRAYRARRAAGPQALPERMTSRARWTRAAGKRPLTVRGRPASSTNSWTWTTFDQVQDGPGDGYGIMLGGGLACWDLDHCIDDAGALAAWAADLLAGIPDPVWAEVSLSGRGLHIFVEAPEARGRRDGNIEYYSRARFIRVTGNPWRKHGRETARRSRRGTPRAA
ncbi:hypothetical protein NQ036_03705 [Brevibacterium sp. 91QC2O2]|uniref:hypothetical protein n=1 Tax=Brevibacterium TaxID=1696 RepID=UPI00211BAC51|nr:MULTISPECIES: hypothetical protein [unclassified Brevibacterium]MCQ9367352.1 hypothetical protein [Brevibacterium sp. 91QC2O2]MCQ9384635.1 hypothetical protein [Brevibacterium sp. 68QC2CO]